MLLENRRGLVMYRIDLAEERLDSAKVLLDKGCFKDSIGRSYSSIFASLRALLASDGVDFSKHTGVISYFQRNYIKSGIFDIKYSDYIREAFQIRNNTDYSDFYIVSREDAELQLQRAKELYILIKEYLLAVIMK